jgi:hypothetical protein
MDPAVCLSVSGALVFVVFRVFRGSRVDYDYDYDQRLRSIG